MIYFNNEYLHRNEFVVSANNRAFKYGDGLFESCLIVNRRAPLLSYNYDRLLKGMHLLDINLPGNWDIAFFDNIITTLCAKWQIANARCKITVWRSGGGLYQPESNEPDLLVEVYELATLPFEHNNNLITLGLYDEIPRLIHPISACKTANALPYVLAANYAAVHKKEDVILLNTAGFIADAISSNIFIVKNNAVYTTLPLNGGIEGTMQAYICDNATNLNIAVSRINMTVSEVLGADEVMLTNAIQGIKFVGKFQDSIYTNNFSAKLLKNLKVRILSQ